MKLLVTGAGGMLGQAVEDVIAPSGIHSLLLTHAALDIGDLGAVMHHVRSFEPTVVLNCAGIRPQSPDRDAEDVDAMTEANGVGPHLLARICEMHGAALVHVSTDCVFSGRRPFGAPYGTTDVPDPVGLYGITKRLGEVEAPHVAVIRTSFIGPDHGVWAWLARARGTVDGWRAAHWTGSTVDAVAARLVAFTQDFRPGLHHLATERPVTKFDVLHELKERFELWDVSIKPTWQPYVNRALIPTLPPLPPIAQALLEYRESPTRSR